MAKPRRLTDERPVPQPVWVGPAFREIFRGKWHFFSRCEIRRKMVEKWHFFLALVIFAENAGNGDICYKEVEIWREISFSERKWSKYSSEKWHFV